MIRSAFRLKKPLGLAYTMDEDDVLKTKIALRDLGHLKRPDYGLSRYPNKSLIDGIRDFQKENGLEVDGVIKPGGPTERRLDAAYSGMDAGRSRHGMGIAEGEWDWFYDKMKIPRPGQRLPTDETPDNRLDDGPVLPPLAVAANRRGGEKAAVRRNKGRRGGAAEVRISAVKGYPWHELLKGIGTGSGQRGGPACRRPPAGPHSTRSLLEALGGTGPGQLTDGKDGPTAKRTDPAPTYPPLPPHEPPREEKPDREEFPARPPLEPIDLTKPLPEPKEPTIFILPMPPADLTQPIGIDRNETEATKKQIDRIRDKIIALRPDWKHFLGGRDQESGEDKKEYYVPGPGIAFPLPGREKGDGRARSGYTDLTFRSKDEKIYWHIQTVDIDKDCKPTKRELDNAERIFRALQNEGGETHHVLLYRKHWQRKGC